jgi:hypothetical protein
MGTIPVGQLVRVYAGILAGLVGEVVSCRPHGQLLITIPSTGVAILLHESTVQVIEQIDEVNPSHANYSLLVARASIFSGD